MWLWPTLFLTVEPQHLVRRWTKAHTLLTTNRPAHSQHTGLHANKAHAQNPRASHKTQARTLTTYRPVRSQRTCPRAQAAHAILTNPTHFSQSPRASHKAHAQSPRASHNIQTRALTTHRPVRSQRTGPRAHAAHALLTKPTPFHKAHAQSPRASHNIQARLLTTYRTAHLQSPRFSHKAHAFLTKPTRFLQHTGTNDSRLHLPSILTCQLLSLQNTSGCS